VAGYPFLDFRPGAASGARGTTRSGERRRDWPALEAGPKHPAARPRPVLEPPVQGAIIADYC